MLNRSCPVVAIVSSANTKKLSDVQSTMFTDPWRYSRMTGASITTIPTHTAAAG